MSFYLYMLRCEDGSIYTGTAKDYLKRYEEHLSGKGAKYTRSHRVKKIERVFLCENRSIACILESEIKKYVGGKKEAVISNPDEFIKNIENNREIKIEKIF